MYQSKLGYSGLEGVAADIFNSIGLRKSLEQNLFIIQEKIRKQMECLRNEAMRQIKEGSNRDTIYEAVKRIKIDEGF